MLTDRLNSQHGAPTMVQTIGGNIADIGRNAAETALRLFPNAVAKLSTAERQQIATALAYAARTALTEGKGGVAGLVENEAHQALRRCPCSQSRWTAAERTEIAQALSSATRAHMGYVARASQHTR